MRPIKRSRQITLGMLAAVSIVALAACDNVEDRSRDDFFRNHGLTGNEEMQVFRDQSECETSRSANECREAAEKAESEHVRTAPQFASREECEREYGESACRQLNDRQARPGTYYGNNSHVAAPNPFIPMMQGYILGSLMSSGGRSAAPVYYGRSQSCASNPNAQGCNGSSSGSAARPVYSGPVVIGRAPSAFSGGSSVTAPRIGGGGASIGPSVSTSRAPASIAISRGGFGGFGSGSGGAS